MKKKSLLLLPLSVLALTSCGKTVNIKDDQNYDVDPISSITDDGGVNDFDSMSVEEENVEVPSEYDSFTDNTIADEGKYYLKGEYPKISITAAKNKVVYVFLDGVTISSSEGIAFGSDNKITLYVVLLNNSVNSISNDFLDTNAFHIKGDVHIQGSGTLNVTSAQKNGLKASKDLYITGSGVSLNVTGANHAISARSIIVNDSTISVNAQKDGIQLECDSDVTEYTNNQGYAYLVNAKVTSVTHGDGIQANSFVYISGGTYNLTTYGEFVPYSSENMTTYELETDDFKYVKSGSTYKRVASDEIRSLSSSYYALANSVKGIKVSEIEYNSAPITTGDYSIYVAHLANITINSPDDCIHTNYGDTTIDSSNLTLDTYDDGVHADYDLVINNSSVVVNSSYEGLEGATVTINGANTNIVTNSGDDGINAASDLSSNNVITINDGYLRVYASGDGLDANTALYLKGGVVIVEGPGSGNGSLDAEKVYFQGGIVFACSTSGMRESMSATQNTFLYQGSTIASGSKISIVDSSDNALFSYTLKQSCNQIIFSHKDLALKSTYRIVNGSTEVASITMSSSLTTVGSSSGGPGGGGPGGGGGWH
jgi:hypothetical protein